MHGGNQEAGMKAGVIVPQGWIGDYDGWDPGQAWERSVAVAKKAEALGFESLWVFDHFHTIPEPTDEITFESFTMLAALAAVTERVRLGHVVICTGFRNPALTAKMISTLDVISGGRMELGIGAGWKRDEWEAYGFGFPSTTERLAALGDHLEVITRMQAPGRATYEGRYARVAGAINVPEPLQQPRVPIMVGGNGPNVTWRLAARYADELNVDGMSPSQVAEALPVIADRCAEIGRDPATLPVSVHMWQQHVSEPGPERVARLAAYAELGVARVMTILRASVHGDEALEAFADDVRAAGAEMA
jgi:F420-dependent oxidoreductase-like protein